MLNAPDNTARTVPAGKPRAVLFNADTWRKIAGWSVLTFAASLGVGIIMWGWLLHPGRDGSWGLLAWRDRGAAPASPVDEPTLEVPTVRRAIDGVRVPEGAAPVSNHRAVMIDNITVARPQAGIAAASVVYEVPVEGGLTRLMAVFPSTVDVARIGPVRSARPYFIDLASEYDALYVHVGGSPEALQRLASGSIRDVNEFSAGKYFRRDPKRSAPHNAYTSSAALTDAASERFSDRPEKEFLPWTFKDDADPAERPDAQTMLVPYDHPNVDVAWTYDPATNEYSRAQGKTKADEAGAPVRAKNVIVQSMKIATIDAVGRLRIGTVGEGDAVVMLDGNAYYGTWRKPSAAARTVFLDASGGEIALNAGPTWIQIVPEGTDVSVTP